ncbi:MAG: hypothetical protein JNL82_33525 [Myxococcales bacterium]|nr:hypothetical protein [Myxococcales bacterium]
MVELALEGSRGHGGRMVLVRLRREGGKISALRISGDDPVTTGGAQVTVVAAGPGRAAWWVKERLVRLAAEVGAPALVPGLVALARDVRVDASVLRTRELALAALAELAGFDARAEPNAGSTESAAAIYADNCRV